MGLTRVYFAEEMKKIPKIQRKFSGLITNERRLVDGCYKKCISTSYSEGEVNKGEALCLDRCVAKYFEVNTKVGEVSKKR